MLASPAAIQPSRTSKARVPRYVNTGVDDSTVGSVDRALINELLTLYGDHALKAGRAPASEEGEPRSDAADQAACPATAVGRALVLSHSHVFGMTLASVMTRGC